MLKFNIFVMGDYSKPAGSGEMQYRLMSVVRKLLVIML